MTSQKMNHNRFRFAQKILLFNEHNEILTIRFSGDEELIPPLLHHKWDFPGGGLEWQESREEGLAREIKEELGDIKYTVDKLIHIWDWYHQTVGGPQELRTICALYQGAYQGGEIVLNREHDTYQWLDLEQINKLDFDYADSKMVSEIQRMIGNQQSLTSL